MSPREEGWEALYRELSRTLSPLGKNEPFGEGDFWLVDDDWGGHHHKICVTKPDFWSNHVQDAIRKVLAASFPNWGVFVVFEDGSKRPGLVVYEDSIETKPRWL